MMVFVPLRRLLPIHLHHLLPIRPLVPLPNDTSNTGCKLVNCQQRSCSRNPSAVNYKGPRTWTIPVERLAPGRSKPSSVATSIVWRRYRVTERAEKTLCQYPSHGKEDGKCGCKKLPQTSQTQGGSPYSSTFQLQDAAMILLTILLPLPNDNLRREDLASTFVRVYGVVASRSDKAGPRRRRRRSSIKRDGTTISLSGQTSSGRAPRRLQYPTDGVAVSPDHQTWGKRRRVSCVPRRCQGSEGVEDAGALQGSGNWSETAASWSDGGDEVAGWRRGCRGARGKASSMQSSIWRDLVTDAGPAFTALPSAEEQPWNWNGYQR
ncbi:hypothetical protein AB1N83_010906 [Pleurotus pulmonarius]